MSSTVSVADLINTTMFISEVICSFISAIDDRADLCADLQQVSFHIRLTASLTNEYFLDPDLLEGWSRSLMGLRKIARRLERELCASAAPMTILARVKFAIRSKSWAEKEVRKLKDKVVAIDKLNRSYVSPAPSCPFSCILPA
jgi:hypothetical protein